MIKAFNNTITEQIYKNELKPLSSVNRGVFIIKLLPKATMYIKPKDKILNNHKYMIQAYL